MAPTVSCACSIAQYSGDIRGGILSHPLLCSCALLCACVRNSATALAAADGRQSASSLATRHAATAALLHSSTKPRRRHLLLQVWVRRPKGEADNPAYQVQKLPHPVKLNVWGCFCGRGLGYCYIFNENMDGKLLKKILGTHLKESAELHFEQDPPELWRLLQDNDPKHKSNLVRTWLFNNGISLLDFPAYSPDLNPIENLWNDMARRVEARPASTVEELQDVIAEEWEPPHRRSSASSRAACPSVVKLLSMRKAIIQSMSLLKVTFVQG